MAEQILTPVQVTSAGILDVAGNASAKAGNAGTPFRFANDGKTVLVVDGQAGDTFTFTVNSDVYGRTKAVAPVVTAGKIAVIGPFPPDLFNDVQGRVAFAPTVGNSTDILLAVKL